jgi:hypothetical protein
MLLVGQGGDHLTSSLVYHDSARTCFYGTSFVSSSGEAIFNNTVCALRFLWSSGSTESFLTTGGGNTAIGNGGTAGLTLYSSNEPRLRISATGDSTFTCRVCANGFSTNASLTMECSSPLSFSGTGGYIYMYSRRAGGSCGAMLINNGTGQNLWFGEVASNTYSFAVNPTGTDYSGTPTLNMDILNGRVGIGCTTPDTPLYVVGEITSQNGEMYFKRSTFCDYGHIYMGSDKNFYIRQTAACSMVLSIGGAEKMRINSGNSIVGYSQLYSTYTKATCTTDGGSQTARYIEDSLGQWIQVGRFASSASTSIASCWRSVRGLSKS